MDFPTRSDSGIGREAEDQASNDWLFESMAFRYLTGKFGYRDALRGVLR